MKTYFLLLLLSVTAFLSGGCITYRTFSDPHVLSSQSVDHVDRTVHEFRSIRAMKSVAPDHSIRIRLVAEGKFSMTHTTGSINEVVCHRRIIGLFPGCWERHSISDYALPSQEEYCLVGNFFTVLFNTAFTGGTLTVAHLIGEPFYGDQETGPGRARHETLGHRSVLGTYIYHSRATDDETETVRVLRKGPRIAVGGVVVTIRNASGGERREYLSPNDEDPYVVGYSDDRSISIVEIDDGSPFKTGLRPFLGMSIPLTQSSEFSSAK